jgi:hypothetical protein
MDSIFYSDKEYEQVLLHLGELTERIHEMEDSPEREMMVGLMQYFDVIHREAVSRLWGVLETRHPELCQRIIGEDYTVRNLLALYDLIEFNGVGKPPEAVAFIPVDQVKILK